MDTPCPTRGVSIRLEKMKASQKAHLATDHHPVREIEARVEVFETGRGFSLRVLADRKRRVRTLARIQLKPSHEIVSIAQNALKQRDGRDGIEVCRMPLITTPLAAVQTPQSALTADVVAAGPLISSYGEARTSVTQLESELKSQAQSLREIDGRAAVVHGLLSRFALLEEHYESDIARLTAIEEIHLRLLRRHTVQSQGAVQRFVFDPDSGRPGFGTDFRCPHTGW